MYLSKDSARECEMIFDDILDFIQYVEEPPYNHSTLAGMRGQPISSHKDRTGKSDDWTGTCYTFGDYIQRMHCGWPEGLSSVAGAAEIASAAVSDYVYKRTLKLAPTGHAPNVAMACQGRPDCMLSRAPQADRPVVSILVDISGSSWCNADLWITRGGALMALIDGLERCGRSVRLDCGFSLQERQVYCTMIVPVKAAGQHLEPDRLASAVADPAMFRRGGFAWIEQTIARTGSRWQAQMDPYGYGLCTPMPEPLRQSYDITTGILDREIDRWRSIKSAQEWLVQTLDKYGVRIASA